MFPSAQRRKLRPFEGFKRRAVVVVVGDEEYTRRQALQEAEDGKDDPDNNILDMKGIYYKLNLFFHMFTYTYKFQFRL